MPHEQHDKSFLENLEKRLQRLEKETEKTIQHSHVGQDIELLAKKIGKEEELAVRKLKRRHKFLYVLCAFLGINLIWYSFWTLISDIPVINNPYVAGTLGILILFALGKFYDNLVW